jgi:hypothetical protein
MKIKEGEVVGACETHAEVRNAYRILIRVSEVKRSPRALVVDGRIMLKCILGK